MEQSKKMAVETYHDVRLPFDSKRKTVWRTLARYFFTRFIKPSDAVLELGAGYCDFINEISASQKIAIDAWPDFSRWASPNVQAIVGDVQSLDAIENDSVDVVFSSNLFEHLTQSQLARCLSEVRRVLKPGGTLIILQPNYRYCYKEYFDDYTHVSVWSHVSLADYLTLNGFKVTDVFPRFLPLSVKSRFPVLSVLIRLYLISPFKPFGKQMMLVSKLKQ